MICVVVHAKYKCTHHVGIYKLMKKLKLLSKVKIIIWILQKFDLSELLPLDVDMNDSSFTQGEMLQGYDD
jgi:hypothetical protein